MNSLEIIKNNLIDNILATNNEELLKAVFSMFKVAKTENKIRLTDEQEEMLMLGEKDIEYGNLVSSEELDKLDKEWLY
jgi:hypothetical protein